MARIASVSICSLMLLICLASSISTSIDPNAVAAIKNDVAQLTSLMHGARMGDSCWRSQVKQLLYQIARGLEPIRRNAENNFVAGSRNCISGSRNIIIGDRNGVSSRGSFLVESNYHAPMNSGLLYFDAFCANLANIEYIDIYPQFAVYRYNGQAYSKMYNNFKNAYSAQNLIACSF